MRIGMFNAKPLASYISINQLRCFVAMNLVNKLLSDSKAPCLIDGSEKYSHQQLKNNSTRLSAGLVKRGIAPKDRVAIIAHNSAEFLISYLAIINCGAIAIPLDPYSKKSEKARDLSIVRPKLILTSTTDWVPENYAQAIDTLEFNSPVWRSYLKLKPFEAFDAQEDDIALMMMTSGPSFQPRPAMLSHGSLIANLDQAQSVNELALESKDVVLAALPMYHIFGLHVVAGLSLLRKSKMVIARTFDPVELASIIAHHKITVLPGVPVLFDAFVRTTSITMDSFTTVRLLVSGGAPMRSEVHEKFKERFGKDIMEGYGLTEASPMVSFSSNPDREGDIGTPLDGVEIDLRDSSGLQALQGDVGQIVIKGKNVFSGYFGDREATAKVLDPNGWLFTGDIGVKGEDGKITLIDRGSDVIAVHGFSVYPSEVENVLLDLDFVDGVSVVGELDESSGERVVAYLKVSSENNFDDDLKNRRNTEKELREHCLKKLARYKVPSKFEFISELGLQASARPLRKSLRAALRNID